MATKQSADTLVDGVTNKVMTAPERTKLSGLSADHASLVWRRDYPLYGIPNSMSSGAWTFGGPYGFNTAGASNTAYNSVWFLEIEPGTWSFDVLAYKATTGGIITYEYSFDNSNWVTIASAVDMYAAALTAFTVTGVTGVVVAERTRLYFRAGSTGTKNASATGYYSLVSALCARRTS